MGVENFVFKDQREDELFLMGGFTWLSLLVRSNCWLETKKDPIPHTLRKDFRDVDHPNNGLISAVKKVTHRPKMNF